MRLPEADVGAARRRGLDLPWQQLLVGVAHASLADLPVPELPIVASAPGVHWGQESKREPQEGAEQQVGCTNLRHPQMRQRMLIDGTAQASSADAATAGDTTLQRAHRALTRGADGGQMAHGPFSFSVRYP